MTPLFKILIAKTGSEYTAELYNDNILVVTHVRRTMAHALLAVSLELCDEIDPTEE